MKNYRFFSYLLAAMLLVTLFSCNKDDDGEDVSPNVSLLTGGEWVGSAVYIDDQDTTAYFEQQTGIDWSKYTTTFNRDGTYAENYDGDVVVEGVWEYANNERVILFDKGTSDQYSVVISKLDEKDLYYVQSGIEYRFSR